MLNIEHALELFDLARLHFVACFIGVLLCVYVMQLIAKGVIKFDAECILSYWSRRVSLTLLGLSMCWSMLYANEKNWQPWLPDVAIILSIDLLLSTSVVLAIRKRRAEA